MRVTLIIICVAAAALSWQFDSTAFFAAYLAVWWFCIGIAMGGLANVWLHNLTGGKWGEVIRVPLLRRAASIWLLALFFIPIALGFKQLYPWFANANLGTARWQGELSSPEFKSTWLAPTFFIARSIFYLFIFGLLGVLSVRAKLQRSKAFAAAALIVYGFTMSLASVDWIMSLMPVWYSSVFGLLVVVGQMLGGFALAVVMATNSSHAMQPLLRRDFGNLLLMYVLSWGYLAYVQFVIIWAENLPHEIVWYVPRARGAWVWFACVLAVGLLIAPLLALLSRQLKEARQPLRWLAAGLFLMQLANTWWLILPSIPLAANIAWIAPLIAAAFGIVLIATYRLLPKTFLPTQESAHA